jgi:hypothetical protein
MHYFVGCNIWWAAIIGGLQYMVGCSYLRLVEAALQDKKARALQQKKDD